MEIIMECAIAEVFNIYLSSIYKLNEYCITVF